MAAASSSETLISRRGVQIIIEEQEAHARVWLDRPFDVGTIIEEVGKFAELKLLPPPFLHVLTPRQKPGVHLNMVVGRVQIQDDTAEGSMFEYGITDQIAMPNSRHRKRKENTQYMYVHALGPRAKSTKNSELCSWFLNRLVNIVGKEFVIGVPNPHTLLKRPLAKNQVIHLHPCKRSQLEKKKKKEEEGTLKKPDAAPAAAEGTLEKLEAASAQDEQDTYSEALDIVQQSISHTGLSSEWTSPLAAALQPLASTSQKLYVILMRFGWAGTQFTGPPDREGLLNELSKHLHTDAAASSLILPASGAPPGLGSQKWLEKMKKNKEESESQKKLREGIQKTREQEITETRKAQNAPFAAKMEEFKTWLGRLCSGEGEAVEKRKKQKKTAEEAGTSSLPVLGVAGVPSTSTPDEPMEVPGDEAGASSLLVTSGAAGVPSASAPDEPMESAPGEAMERQEAEDVPFAEFATDWEFESDEDLPDDLSSHADLAPELVKRAAIGLGTSASVPRADLVEAAAQPAHKCLVKVKALLDHLRLQPGTRIGEELGYLRDHGGGISLEPRWNMLRAWVWLLNHRERLLDTNQGG